MRREGRESNATMQALSAGSSAVTAAIGVAICAGAPEFIWQGLGIVAGHLGPANLVSAALIALILVFFVEPVLERVRGWLTGEHHDTARGGRRHLLIAVGIGLLIAFTSVGLHDAMAAFTTAGDQFEGESGLDRAVTITISWGVVPFSITLAWLAFPRRALAIVLGVIAAASSFLAAWYYAWGVTTAIVTAVPCLAIQFLGYRYAAKPSTDATLARFAPMLAAVAIAWLVFATLFDAVVLFFHAGWLSLYDVPDWFIDARFYLGWFLGLMLTRSPATSAEGRANN